MGNWAARGFCILGPMSLGFQSRGPAAACGMVGAHLEEALCPKQWLRDQAEKFPNNPEFCTFNYQYPGPKTPTKCGYGIKYLK